MTSSNAPETTPATEPRALLDRAAAAGLHRLIIPTPFLVGPVNCWLIDDEPLTLLDTGPNSGDALDALEAALAEHGRRVEDLERIVISHQHYDHEGLLAILARRSGAEVCALDLLAPLLEAFAEQQDAELAFAATTMQRHGVPRDVVSALRAASATAGGWGGTGGPVGRPLRHGEALEFAGRSLRVWHRPGHSPTDTLLHDEDRGLLLGADHLLAHVSSNPLLARPLDGDERRPPGALITYLDSLHATREMEGVEVVLPGHGEPFVDAARLIDERLGLHERRATRIERAVAQRPRTAYQIGQELWGEIALTQPYLCISEVLGHIGLLLARGTIAEQAAQDGVVHYTAAA